MEFSGGSGKKPGRPPANPGPSSAPPSIPPLPEDPSPVPLPEPVAEKKTGPISEVIQIAKSLSVIIYSIFDNSHVYYHIRQFNKIQ